MTFPQHLAPAHAAPPEALRELGASLATFVSKIGGWFETCTDYYAAAALYERLSALSDAELARRGLSRATLAQHACEVCERGD
jgi:hypothetical protein